ncbi:hypothetical protein ACIRNY_10755 [Capnocytophaga canimorsus]|uniref:hypothetical protein n=1 Tax=Capnocytophaga canimorsus TaxID=28188 RepID=UPI00384FEDAA
MSYDISIYRIETKLKEQQYKGDDFFDNTGNFVPFTKEQKQYFRENLEAMDYEFHQENEYGSVFWHEEYGEALLSDKALYFSTSFNEDCIFEVGLFASELAMEDEFAKYDPQNTGWEEIE